MVGQVPVDVKSEPLDPGREANVDRGIERAVNLVPVLRLLPAS